MGSDPEPPRTQPPRLHKAAAPRCGVRPVRVHMGLLAAEVEAACENFWRERAMREPGTGPRLVFGRGSD